MKDKFKNKYRSSSIRLQNWDYASNAMYFVTICAHDHICFFGDVIDGKMNLNENGEIAENFWIEIPRHFPFVILDEFIVMPNHVHGIIIINKPNNLSKLNVDTPDSGVSTGNFENSQTSAASKKWKPGTLGVIINQYKRIVTLNARKIQSDFAWQSRYYENIIRNDISYQRIKNYIANNPKKWNKDKSHIVDTPDSGVSTGLIH